MRLVIGEPDQNQVPRFVLQEIVATRLGEGLGQSEELSPKAIERTLEGLKKLQKSAFNHGVKMPEAYATAWARKASNTDEMLSAIAEINLPVWILTAEEEAAMGLEAAMFMDPSLQDFWMIDIGGGSTQIIQAAGGKLSQFIGVPLGAVNATENDTLATIANEKVYLSLFSKDTPKKAIALGGTAACLAALKTKTAPQDPKFFERAQGLFLETSWIGEQQKLLASLPLEERRKLPGMEVARADILPAGALLLHAFLAQIRADGATICLYSFIHGLFAKLKIN